MAGPLAPQVIGMALALHLWVLPMSAQDDDVAGDRAALMAFYEATDGDNWNNNSNWGSDEPPGSWHGVITNAQGRVTELRLEANRLNGEIPDALGKLSNLQLLNLPRNKLSGAIPDALGNLTKLHWLDLHLNQLSGAIPGTLGNLTACNG